MKLIKKEIIICPHGIKFMILAGCGYDDASYILGRPVPLLAYVPKSRNSSGCAIKCNLNGVPHIGDSSSVHHGWPN